MSNTFYEETLLREEYKLVAKLQKDPEFSKYGKISYEDRNSDNKFPVSKLPTGTRYPEVYLVEFKMPVYESVGRLRNDWVGNLMIQLSEDVLMDRKPELPPDVYFTCNFSPFNNHVKDNWICAGNAWAVAMDNGLWHFIVSLGALINQDRFVTAETKREHLNPYAFDYWVERGKKPVSDIKWPIDLLTREEIKITPKEKVNEPSKIVITPKSNATNKHTSIIIVPKAKTNEPEIKITIKKK